MLDQESLYYLVKFWRNRAEQAEAANAGAGGEEDAAEAAPAPASLTYGKARGETLPAVYAPPEPDYRAELAEARKTIAGLKHDLRSAQAEVRWLEAKLKAAERQAAAPRRREDARFQAVKREFAKRYHPSTNPSDGLGSRLGQKAREAIFKDFWPMFETSDDTYERSTAA
ncbi:MAG: hypothetical protein GVY13_16285 [Alphaproteobacteria bacterium]|jgi:hypothetical protein|nr:hypothetical protein [Alphaproteobacteria bacterium]